MERRREACENGESGMEWEMGGGGWMAGSREPKTAHDSRQKKKKPPPPQNVLMGAPGVMGVIVSQACACQCATS